MTNLLDFYSSIVTFKAQDALIKTYPNDKVLTEYKQYFLLPK